MIYTVLLSTNCLNNVYIINPDNITFHRFTMQLFTSEIWQCTCAYVAVINTTQKHLQWSYTVIIHHILTNKMAGFTHSVRMCNRIPVDQLFKPIELQHL